MTDDVKGFRERITAAMERIAAGHSPMRIPADMTDPDIVLSDCLAHIEGEAARTAAAVAAAREECVAFVRQSGNLCRRSDDSPAEALWTVASSMERVDASGKPHTPLADRIAELEAEVSRRDALIRADGYEDMRLHAADLASRAEKAEADAWRLRTQVEAAEAEHDTLRRDVTSLTAQVEALMPLEAERDALADSLAYAAGATVEQAKALHEKMAIGIRTERDALRAEKEQEWREHLAEKAAFASEVASLRAQVEAAVGFEFLARLLAWVEPMTSGYMRAPSMKGRPAQTWHLDDICAGAKAAVVAMDGAKP